MKRDEFLKASALTLGGIWTLSSAQAMTPQDELNQIDKASIKEFVTAGHGNMDKVKEMLADRPNLISCRYDWGSGDFEEAIEGAGHVGNKKMVEYLISKGARVNLFVLTMLGKTKLVKPILEEYPNLIQAHGAHGLTLLHHAKKGGDAAAELYDYLSEKGLTKMNVDIKGY